MDKFNHSDLSREEILSLLMDGELHDANEQSLFAEMAKDTDLQAQLKETLAMREAIKSDSEAFAPPPNVTTDLFSKLGYAQKPKITPLGFDWSRFMRRVAAPLMLLMLAITLPLVYNVSTDTNTLEANSSEATSAPIISSVSDNKSQTPANVSNTDIAVNHSATTNSVITNSYSSVRVMNDSPIELVSSTRVELPNRFISSNEDRQTSKLALGNIAHSSLFASNGTLDLRTGSSDFPIADVRTLHNTRQQREWSLHLRGIYNVSGSGQASQAFNPMKNFAAGMMMKLSNEISFGLEGGREEYNFSTAVEGLYEDPYVFWYALSFRYLMNDFKLAGITPYLRVNGGGSSRGPVFAAYLGGEYRLSNTYALTFGYGTSLLTYKSNNLQYATTKTGLNFGLNLRF